MKLNQLWKGWASTWGLWAALALPAPAQFPPSNNAPRTGQKAPDFTLPDKDGKSVKLADLYSAQGDQPNSSSRAAAGKARWVLLIFYRGYW